MMQVEVRKGYRSQLVQKEKRKEVIHYNFSSWLPAKQRKEHVLWDFPAGKNILTGWLPNTPANGGRGESLETYIFMDYISVLASTLVVLIWRVAWWYGIEKKKIPNSRNIPKLLLFLFFRAHQCFSAFSISALLCFPPPKNQFCLLAPCDPCAEHGNGHRETPGRSVTVSRMFFHFPDISYLIFHWL